MRFPFNLILLFLVVSASILGLVRPALADVPQACCRVDPQTLNPGCTAFAATEVCLAMIPWCEDIWGQVPEPQLASPRTIQFSVRETLSRKLSDLYRGFDTPIALPPSVLAGLAPGSPPLTVMPSTPFADPVCSLVGDKVALSGTGEIDATSNASYIKIAPNINIFDTTTNRFHQVQNSFGRSCGTKPSMQVSVTTGSNGSVTGYNLALGFNNGAGSQWMGAIRGAYTWAIRAEAYHVLKSIANDLSNAGQIIGDQGALGADHNQHYLEWKNFYSQMSPDEKDECVLPNNLKKESQLAAGELTFCPLTSTVNDPAQRRCTQAKISVMAARASLHYLLIRKILERAANLHQYFFGSYFAPAAQNNVSLLPVISNYVGRRSTDVYATDFTKTGNDQLTRYLDDCNAIPTTDLRVGSLRVTGPPTCTAACIFGGLYQYSNNVLTETINGNASPACGLATIMRMSAQVGGVYKTKHSDLANTTYQGQGLSALISAGAAPHYHYTMFPYYAPFTPTSVPAPAYIPTISSSNAYWSHSAPIHDRSTTFVLSIGALGVFERIIRVNYCGQTHLADTNNVCDKINIPTNTVLPAGSAP